MYIYTRKRLFPVSFEIYQTKLPKGDTAENPKE